MDGVLNIAKKLAFIFVATLTGIWCCAFGMPILALSAVVAFLLGPVALGIWLCGQIIGQDWNLITFSRSKK